MISPRDEIWIDMMQFDTRAADGLWEGDAPPPGAPGWYGDVSGLIETAAGPAEPHELVDEPIVVEDMHRTTRDRPRRRCHHGRTVGRAMAMKAAAATTATVFGVAAAAATTGIVATVATVVVPAIEERFILSRDEPGSAEPLPGPRAGTPDIRLDDQVMTLTGARSATPESGAASVTPAPAGPAVEPVVDAAPPAAPAPLEPVPANPAAAPVTPEPAAVIPAQPSPVEPAPPADPKPVKPAPAERTPPAKKPRADAPRDEAPAGEVPPPADHTPAAERDHSSTQPTHPSSSTRSSRPPPGEARRPG